MSTTSTGALTEQETLILRDWAMWGSDGYPVSKRGGKWWVDGQHGRGAFPCAFATKRVAQDQWCRFIAVLIEKEKGDGQ